MIDITSQNTLGRIVGVPSTSLGLEHGPLTPSTHDRNTHPTETEGECPDGHNDWLHLDPDPTLLDVTDDVALVDSGGVHVGPKTDIESWWERETRYLFPLRVSRLTVVSTHLCDPGVVVGILPK